MENTKTINVRFTQEEWEVIEKARVEMGVRSRGNFLRIHLIPICRNLVANNYRQNKSGESV